MAEVISSLKSWLGGQMPSVQKSVKPIHLDDDEVLLHVGPSKIKSFYPRVPGSVAPGEDTTVGRVCCSLTLEKALWGGRHHLGTNRLYLYAFKERDVVVPSVSLTQEGKRGNEVWIVPHRMENWNIVPERVGEARLISMSEGEDTVFYYIVKIDYIDIPFDNKVSLKAGSFYEFSVICEPNKTVIEFKGAAMRELWDRAALEYTVSLR